MSIKPKILEVQSNLQSKLKEVDTMLLKYYISVFVNLHPNIEFTGHVYSEYNGEDGYYFVCDLKSISSEDPLDYNAANALDEELDNILNDIPICPFFIKDHIIKDYTTEILEWLSTVI